MTTPTTQREADEKARWEKWAEHEARVAYRSEKQGLVFYDAGTKIASMVAWQARAAIDQSTRQAAPEDAYRACIEEYAKRCGWDSSGDEGAIEYVSRTSYELGKKDAAATDQPSAGQVDERTLFDAWISTDTTHYMDTRDRLFAAWQAGRASLTPTAPAEQIARVILHLIGEGAMDWKAAPGLDPDDAFNSDTEELNILADLVNKALATPTAPQAASQQVPLDFETIQRIGKRAEFIREKLGEAVRWCYANAGADKTPDGLLEDIAERVEWIRRDAETLAQQAAPQAATTASTECKHEFYYFGDQVSARRCLHCNKLEDAATTASPRCTCPSGDGSLRWPCPAHPQ